MKTTELMIGDWIGYIASWYNEEDPTKLVEGWKTPIPVRVEWLTPDTIQYTDKDPELDTEVPCECLDYELRPIPLTTEILEKNFPKRDSEADYVKERIVAGFSVNWFPLSGSNGVFFIILDMPFKTEMARIEHIHKGAFRYVHEIQHLLRLCGIEKEIAL